MKRIGVDCDGVLADFSAGFSRLSEELLKKPLPTVPDRWDWWEGVLSGKEVSELWGWIGRNPSWWARLAPLSAERIYLLRKWENLGHDVYILTARQGGTYVRWHTSTWLQLHAGRHFPVLMLEGAEGKAKAASALNLTHFIDDHPENVEAVQRAVKGIRAVLFDAPYNRTYSHLPRVKELNELLEEGKK